MSMTEKSKLVADPSRYIIQIQGPPKIGKTEFVAANPKTFFFNIEDGLKQLSVFSEPEDDPPMKSWGQFLEICRMLQEIKDPPFNDIAVDGINRLVGLCMTHVGGKYDFIHPTDLGWGKGWDLVRTEFIRAISKLTTLPFGLWLIGHTKISKRQITVGNKKEERDFAASTIVDNICQLIDQFVDLTLYCHFDDSSGDKGERIISCRSSRYWAAGGRILMPETIPLNRKIFDEEFAKAVQKQNETKEGK